MKQRGIVLWITGLPCSGKTSISDALHSRLKKERLHSHVLDGDVIRKGLGVDLNFTEKDRRENIRRVGEVSKLFAEANLIILIALISPFRNDRDKVRSILKPDQFIEIYLDCPMEVCEKRDVKGMYKKARARKIENFTGISSPYEPPINPEIRLQTHRLSIEESVDVIFEYLTKVGF
jgi:adenylylsulfate kinase